MPTVRRNRVRRTITAKVEWDLYEALAAWAVENEIIIGAGRANISEAVGLLLQAALADPREFSEQLREQGYQAGRRQGLSEARAELAKVSLG